MYILKITNEELLRLRKREQLVLFLKEKQKYINKTTVLFAIPYKDIYRIVGQAKIDNTMYMDRDKLKKVLEDSKNGTIHYLQNETLDLKNPYAVSEYGEEIKLFSYLQNGYEVWKKTKERKTKLIDYLLEIGYAENIQNIYTQQVPWWHAVMISEIDIYPQTLSTYFFSDVEKVRDEYLKIVNYCNDYMNMKCWQCEYIRICMEDNIRLRKYPLSNLDKQWTEAMYIYDTLSGLKPIKRENQ